MIPVKAKQLARQSQNIPGWFSKEASMLFAWIDEIQKRNNISGDCFEIGCHHGKSAVLLGALTTPGDEKLAVCDLFGQQSDNVSRSGNGDLDAFNANMSAVVKAGVEINVFQKNSAHLTPEEIGDEYRIFHVDGGHNPDEALLDLRLAAKCTVDSGVIILDDPFRMEWPGVTEALIRFLDEQPEYQAIMTGFNKVVLTRDKWSGIYLAALESTTQRENFGFGYPWRVKHMPFHKTDLRVFYVPDYLQKKSIGNLARWVYNKSDFLSAARERRAVKSKVYKADLSTPPGNASLPK